MLCFRCEYRAVFLETGHGPRYECGCIDTSKGACYMYVPSKPVTLDKLIETDERSVYAPPILSARTVVADDQEDLELKLKIIKGNKHIKYWEPK